MSRREARLAAIDAAQAALERADAADQAAGWTEASAFNVDARNDAWRQLDGERAATLVP